MVHFVNDNLFQHDATFLLNAPHCAPTRPSEKAVPVAPAAPPSAALSKALPVCGQQEPQENEHHPRPRACQGAH